MQRVEAVCGVCVFLFSIDRADRLSNEKTPVVAGKVKNATRFLIGTRWVIREGCPSSPQVNISYTTTNERALFPTGLSRCRAPIPATHVSVCVCVRVLSCLASTALTGIGCVCVCVFYDVCARVCEYVNGNRIYQVCIFGICCVGESMRRRTTPIFSILLQKSC